MSTIVSAVLIATPPAFLTGWILSKVLFRHISLTRPNMVTGAAATASATVAASSPAGASTEAGQPSNTASADTRRVNLIRQKLAGAVAEAQSLQSETQLLKEAAAEREHKVLELKRKLQVQLTVPEESLRSAPAKQKQFVTMLEDRLATHQHRIDELKLELEVAGMRAKRATQRFRKWRQKFKPMVRQFRQQRRIINELREELRQRDLEQQKIAATRPQALKAVSASPPEKASLPAVVPPVASTVDATVPAVPRGVTLRDVPPETSADVFTDNGNEEREDLQALRGIGPALHKRLNAKGVYRLQQLAFLSPQELTSLGKSLGVSQKLLARHNWTQQARRLLNMPAVPSDEKVPA